MKIDLVKTFIAHNLPFRSIKSSNFLTNIAITSLDYQVEKRNNKILLFRKECLDLGLVSSKKSKNGNRTKKIHH
jgi:hypothetical protein